MKKFLLVLTALTFLLVSCPDPSSGGKRAEPVKPTPKASVIFDNTYGVCTAVVYDDYRRRDEDKIAEVPAGQRSPEIGLPPSDSEPFYFAYLLNLNGVSDYTVNYVPKNGKDQKAVRLDANTKNIVIIPKFDETFSSEDQLLSTRSTLLLQNASTFSFELHRGRSSVSPDGKTSSPTVNSWKKAFYTINTSDVFDPSAKIVSNYHLLVGVDYKEFPDSPDHFEPGHFYSYTYYSNVAFDLDIPIKFENVTVKTYTVTFSVNGGNGTAPSTQTAKAGSVIRLPDGNGLTKTGYTFGGWNIAASGEEINYSAGSDYLATGDITLYAKWYPLGTVTYTVTFDSNDGSVVATQYTASGLTAFRPTNPIRTGYAFVDWYGDFGLSKVYNFSSPITGNITLYAKWETIRHTVTFNPNGADGTVTSQQPENNSSEITLPDGTNLIKDGYVFGGWSTDDSGVGETYSPGASYTVTGDITLFPKWEAISQTGTVITINLYEMDEWDLITQSADVDAGEDQLFSVSGTYSAYQWYLDGTQAGTGSTYAFNQSAGVYEVVIVVTNSAGEKRSGRCRVTVAVETATVLNASNVTEFASALSGIQTGTDTNFIVNVTSDLSLGPQTLTLAAYRNKTITLKGNSVDRKITLSSQGSLFTVGADVKLVLKNITLQGRSDNNTSLVKVNKDGKLVVNSGGKVTGNTYTTSDKVTGGAGIFVDGGTLEIKGGEISENRLTYSNTSYLNSDVRGGGVYAANGSTVLMSGGIIKNNHINSTRVGYGGSSGGGIAIYNGSVFEMISGIIEGNTITDQVTGGDSYAVGGGVRISGAPSLSLFNFKGGIIRNNTCNSIAPSNMGIAIGGGITCYIGSNSIMSGGIVSGNTCTSSSSPNRYNGQYLMGAYGGGLYFWYETQAGYDSTLSFLKTGGIIYGNEVVGNDEDGIPLKNTAQSTSNGLGGGHAVFYNKGSDSTNLRRNSTANANNNMDISKTGSAGGWE